MFQVTCGRVLMNNRNTVGALQFFRHNTGFQNRVRAKETRDVKLIGTISQNPFILKDGSQILSIKTVKEDNHYNVHRAIVRSPNLLKLIDGNLTIGQRVYIAGELQAENFVNNENQQRQSFQVRVNELYASKVEASVQCADQNHVCILSYIVSDIIHNETHSAFNLIGHFIQKNAIDGDSEKMQIYRVFVHEPELIQLLKDNLQRRDRVVVNGFMNSKPEIAENGQKKYSGHIEATHILKVDRFSEAVNEKSIEEDVKPANE